MVDLHEHNQRTYKNICRMYGEGIQRVAVVQPTGSGKSLLMAKLIEDSQDSRFFILSTSHKINDQFKSKLEEEMPERINCNIYCNMPNMKREDMELLQPDYILLDEMHRALAKEWSKGIMRLLEMYPNAKVLGLSATHIRYLDRCRNVVNELFGGNLACDMSLSQSILDGILPMARYVCGVYSFQKDTESLNKKIEKSCNSEEEKKELLKELKILKENLDKANGVSDIFKKYVVNGNEKFVVFLKILWDGMGLADEEIFQDNMDGFIYCRSHFFKLCLFRGNIQEYFRDYYGDDYETATVTDMFDNVFFVKDMGSYAIMDNKISAAQYAIGNASNIAQLALSYYYDSGGKNRELEDVFIICSVLAQVAIDGCKREFDINVNSELQRLGSLPPYESGERKEISGFLCRKEEAERL